MIIEVKVIATVISENVNIVLTMRSRSLVGYILVHHGSFICQIAITYMRCDHNAKKSLLHVMQVNWHPTSCMAQLFVLTPLYILCEQSLLHQMNMAKSTGHSGSAIILPER